MENENDKKIKQMLYYFYLNKRNIHVTLKQKSKAKPRFYNGRIVSVDDKLFILNDEKLGDMPIFLDDIENVSPRIPKEVAEVA